MRVLVVTVFTPSLAGDHGGSRAVAWRILALAERFDVRVLHLRDQDEPEPVLPGIPIEAVTAPRRSRIRNRASVTVARVRGIPPFVASVTSGALADAVRHASREWRPHVVQLEHVAAAGYARVVRSLPPDARPAVVLAEHDAREAETRAALAAEQPSRRHTLDARAWSRWVGTAYTLADGVIALTREDQRAVQGRAPATPSSAIALRAPSTIPLPATESVVTDTILYVGNYSHHPNRDAARRLAATIMPTVRQEVPGARLALAGPGDPGFRSDPSRGIEVLGRVDDLSELVARSAVIVAPVRLGGGVRVKTIEALEAGKAVVASPRGIEGLDVVPGRDLLCGEDDGQIAALVADLLRDPARRRSLEQAAHEWAVERSREPDGTAEAHEAFYRALGVDLARRSASAPRVVRWRIPGSNR